MEKIKLNDAKIKVNKVLTTLLNYKMAKSLYLFEIKIKIKPRKNKNIFLKSIVDNVADIIKNNIELSEFLYSVYSDKNNEVYIIFGMRPLLGIFLEFEKKLKQLFCYYYRFDEKIEIQYLHDSKVECQINSMFKRYPDIKKHKYISFIESYNEDSVLHDIFYGDFRQHRLGSCMQTLLGKKYNIIGSKIKASISDSTIIELLNNYLSVKNLFVFKNKIYKKQENTASTWCFFADLDFLRNNIKVIMEFLLEEFSFQLKFFDYNTLLNNYSELAFLKIEKTPGLLSSISRFDNVIEFLDGYYFIETKEFRNKRAINEEEDPVNDKIRTTKAVFLRFLDLGIDEFDKIITKNDITI